MSNINNKHIPEDLDSLTRKDMVELFKIQIEEHQGFIKEIETLRTQLAKANERESVLSCHLDSHIERVAELEKENKRESMELRSRLGSALGRNSEYNSAIENMQHKLTKANERVRELEQELLHHKNVNRDIHLKNSGIATLVSELTGNSVVLPKMKTRGEIKSALNKFSIEKKIDGVQLVIDALASKGMLDTLISFAINSVVEQLRKEQE